MTSTAICRHEGCGQRFTLSRYGNRTYTSERRRKGHLFCSSRCRKAHNRRMTALRGGVTKAQGGTNTKGGVTSLKIIQQNQELLAPKKTTEQPHSALREWLQIRLEDEAPSIGSGLRLIVVDKITPNWVRIRDHAGRTAKLTVGTYASLKPVAFGCSAAMDQYEVRFPNAATDESSEGANQ